MAHRTNLSNFYEYKRKTLYNSWHEQRIQSNATRWQSRRLTQFVIGNQQIEFKRLFYGISIGPAAFSAIMSKIFRPLILDKNVITNLDDIFMQSQTESEKFIVLDKHHQILFKEDMQPQKTHLFSSPVQNSLDILLKEIQKLD